MSVTTEQECLDALREAAARLGQSPSKEQYEKLGLTPASATILRVCGGWNAAKERAGLETNASRGPRVGPKPPHVEASDEEWASMSVDQRWHYRNRELNAQRTLDRRRRLRDWLDIHKSSLGCANCDEADPACLDFHHVRGEKVGSVGQMVTDGYSAADLHGEIQKCKVICANCHIKQHVSNPTYDGDIEAQLRTEASRGIPRPGSTSLSKEAHLRAWTRLYKQREGCRDCPEDDGRCLQFHHEDSEAKDEGVGRLISDSGPTASVIREVNRSTVLCANCHRREHR